MTCAPPSKLGPDHANVSDVVLMLLATGCPTGASGLSKKCAQLQHNLLIIYNRTWLLDSPSTVTEALMLSVPNSFVIVSEYFPESVALHLLTVNDVVSRTVSIRT